MAEITVSIAGRPYRMACDDGEEVRLGELAGRLDAKIAELRGQFGEIGDRRITVMAALTMVDDLSDAERRITALELELRELRDAGTVNDTRSDETADAVAAALNGVADRIGRLARKLGGRLADHASDPG